MFNLCLLKWIHIEHGLMKLFEWQYREIGRFLLIRWYFLLLIETETKHTILCINSTWNQLDFLRFSPALTHCEELFWDRLGCFTPWPRMLGGQILASGHGQQKGIRCWDIASPTLSAKGSLRPLWAVVDRCHSSHHTGCDVRGSSVCSHYLLPRELRRSAGRVSVHKGCFSVLQKGLSCST